MANFTVLVTVIIIIIIINKPSVSSTSVHVIIMIVDVFNNNPKMRISPEGVCEYSFEIL